jgi:crotonobetainyl-CoA:carnitine CoA-transferase CaiB-like acyl-CoA transferase
MKIVDLSSDVGGQWAAKLFAMDDATVLRPVTDDARPRALATYLDAYKQIVPWTASLVEDADLVFTTFDEGRFTGFADGLAIPESCVHVTTSTFGMTGPYASHRGGPVAAWAAGGYLAITGKPDREPLIGPEYLCEYLTGYTAAVAAEAALRRKRLTGRGEHVDIAAMEAMLPMHQTTFSNLAFGQARRRTGRFYEVYPMGAVQCRDGHVTISVVTEEEFDRFAVAIGRPELLTDPRFASSFLRFENRDALDALMAPFLQSHDADEIVGVLHLSGVTAAKVALAEDIRANPQLAYRGFWHKNSTPGNPVPRKQVFAGSPDPVRRPRLAARATGDLPLAGVVVADFTVYWAGPSATRTLADLGARVIWIERPGSRERSDLDSDPSSASAALLFATEMSRNKESVVLDLNDLAGRAAARALIAGCDIVVENNRPGVMDKIGLGAAAMCAEHPDLVYVSLPGFGSSGPWSQRRSYGPIIEAASSIVGRTGYEGDEPLRLGHPLPDPTGGMVGALAALRGLRQRDQSGVGGWFDVSQLEGYLALSGEELIGGGPLPRIGNRSRWNAQLGVFPCAGDDEWIAVRLIDEHDAAVFRKLAGCDLSDRAAVCAFTREAEKFALMQILQAGGIEAFPSLKPEDLPQNPQLRERGVLLDLRFGDRDVVIAGSPLGGLADPTGPSPNFGDHTKGVLRELDSAVACPAAGKAERRR